MSDSIERAILLIDNNRHAEAETLLRAAIGEDPSAALAYALLADALTGQEKLQEAGDAARQAVGLAPDDADYQVMLARKLIDLDEYREAGTAVETALRLDPENVDGLTAAGLLALNRREFDKAAQFTDEALRLDPNDEAAQHLRVMATTARGEHEDALEAADVVLEENPESAGGHLARGLVLLEQKKYEDAAEHFKEALRIDPTLDFARECLGMTLKARNPIYRLYLRWSSFTERLDRKQLWLLIGGSYVFIRFLRGFARSNPEWEPYVAPIIFAYVGLVFLSWTSEPIFNSLLRLDKQGRWFLTKRQLASSNAFLGLLGSGAVLAIAGATLDVGALFVGGLLTAALCLPGATAAGAESQRARRILGRWFFALAALALLAAGSIAVDADDLFLVTVVLFVLGYLGFTFYGAKLQIDNVS